MIFDLCIKSGTGGYFDSDGCDLCITRDREIDVLPKHGDKIRYYTEKGSHEFIVVDIRHDLYSLSEYVYGHKVYVVPTDGKNYGE